MVDAAPQLGLNDPWEILAGGFREPGAGLPEPWQSVIGPWDIPDRVDRPYVFINFMISRDGRVTFNEPDNFSPVPIALGKSHDPWMMGVLRARADAVMVGDGTLKANADHVWRADYVLPHAADAFSDLRAAEGLPDTVPLVVLSFDAELPTDAVQFTAPESHTILIVTDKVAEKAHAFASQVAARVDVRVHGHDDVDLVGMMRMLRSEYGIRRLLCEGGPRVYASLLAANLVDDEFLTLSPMVLGAATERVRPSLVEGIAFSPGNAPVSRLLSVARSGDFLFLRSRYATD